MKFQSATLPLGGLMFNDVMIKMGQHDIKYINTKLPYLYQVALYNMSVLDIQAQAEGE